MARASDLGEAELPQGGVRERADELLQICAARAELLGDIVGHQQRGLLGALLDLVERRPPVDQHHVRVVRTPQLRENDSAAIARVVAASASMASVPGAARGWQPAELCQELARRRV